MTHIPEVRIKYAWLLSDAASVVMNEKWGDGTPLRSYDEYEDIADKYEKWWRASNDEILTGMCDLLTLDFKQNIIDVHVAPWFSPISDPLVLGPAFDNKDSFTNTLTHELLHRLLTDNTTYEYTFDFLTQWREAFGDEHTNTTLVHIPVHAALEALYRDVLHRPHLLELELREVKGYEEYQLAWDYVRKIGYRTIIQTLVDLSLEEKRKIPN